MSEPTEFEAHIDESPEEVPHDVAFQTADADSEPIVAESEETSIPKEPTKPRTDREIERKLRVPPLFLRLFH